MFDIYIKDFNQNGRIITNETLIQTVPAKSEGGLRFISPIVKCEMGKVEGFDFSIEPGTPFYDAFLQMKTFIRVVYDGTTIFYGRVLTIDNNGFRGTRKIRCEGPLSFLMDSPVEGVEETRRKTITTYQYLQELIASHNNYINNEANKCFALGNVPGNYSGVSSEQQIKNDSRPFGSDSWTDTKSALEDLRSHYGGFLRTRAGAIGSPIYLDWMNHYFNPTTVSQKIEVGKNILDISNITEIDNVFTAIIPIGRKNVTKSDTGNSSSKQENLYIDGKILRVPDIVSYFDSQGISLNSGYHTRSDYQNAINKYGIIIKTVSLTDSTTKEKLYADACEWIRNNYQGEVTKFTIKALDMHMIQGITGQNVSKIMVGDRVSIVYPVGKEDGSFEKRTTIQTCLSITYDLYHPENTSYTFGIPANILTKTYGLKKKTGSVNNAVTQKSTSGGVGKPRDKDWLDVAGGWLMNHLLHYTPPSKSSPYYPYPLDEQYAGYMNGAPLYDPSAKTLVYAQKGTPGTGGQERWIATIRSYENFDYETIEKYHVCEYILYEYGIDIRTMLEVAYPGMTLDSSGNMTFWKNTFNAVTGQWEKAKAALVLLGEAFSDHTLDIYSPDGEQIHSFIDSSGDWNYYYIDPKTGEKVSTKVRDLTITAVQDDHFIGSMVEEGYGYRDAQGEAHIYKFGQAIENWYDGEVVIAHVDGDVVKLGSEKTQWASSVAQKVNGVFLGATEYIVDPVTGEKSAILIGQAGQASYRARLETNPDSPYYNQYVQDPNGDVILTGDGFWDEKNLAIKGGVYTVDDPDHPGKYMSYVKSSQLVIGDRNLRTTVLDALRNANVIDGDGDTPHALVAQTIYTQDLNAINVRCSNIETNYLRTTNLSAAISQLSLVQAQAIEMNSVSSYIECSGYMYAQDFRIGATGHGQTSYSIKDAISEVQVVGPTSNVYTLQYKTFNNQEWSNAGTFSRATTLTGAWSGGTYTVSASPQGNKNSTTLRYISPDQDIPITSSGTFVTRTFKVMYGPDDDHLYETGYAPSVSINASGQGTVSGSWSNGTYTAKASLQNKSTSTTLRYLSPSGNVSSSGTIVTRTFKVQYGPDNDHLYDTGYEAPVSISANGQGTVSGSWSNGTYTATASLQNKSTSTTLRYLSPTGNVSSSGTTVSRTFKVQYGPDNDHLYDTGYQASVSISASGQGTVSGSWSNGTYTATASLQNKSTSTTLRYLSPTGDISVNGKVVSRKFKVQYGPDNDHLYDTGYSSDVSIDASDVYSDGETAGYSSGYSDGYNTGLPSGIDIGSLTYHDNSWNKSGATQISALNQGSIWSNNSDTYGYLSFPVNVHGKTKTYYFSFDNRKLESGGNTAYGAGYKAGETSGWSDGYTDGWDAGAKWANDQYKHKYTGTLYVNGTISAGNGSWYFKS